MAPISLSLLLLFIFFMISSSSSFAQHNDHKTLSLLSRIVEKKFKLPYLSDNNPTIHDLAHHAGYYRIPNTQDARMFYYFFESRNRKSDPVVLWLTGGPGCGGAMSMFKENGPFHITSNLSLQWNDFGWDKVSNIIYVDQPTGTGFSYSSSEDDIRHDQKGVSNDLYEFMQAFYKEHPEYAENEFYVTGHSYAGHYIPPLAARILKGNKNNEGIHINLKGFAIGNGLTNPGIQISSDAQYALNMKLINQSVYDSLKTLVSDCERTANLCGTNGNDTCLEAYRVCDQISQEVLNLNDNLNYFDIRKKCVGPMCYDFSLIEKYMNQDSVKDALGVNREIVFISCNPDVYQDMLADVMRNYADIIPRLLEHGLKFLSYAGEYDMRCNWLGISRWMSALKWSGRKEYLAAPKTQFSVEGVEAGLLKAHGPMSFLKVYNAGHLMPMDQPKAALEMLRAWMQGKL